MRKPSVANGLREELVARDVARAIIEAMRAAGRKPSKAGGPRR